MHAPTRIFWPNLALNLTPFLPRQAKRLGMTRLRELGQHELMGTPHRTHVAEGRVGIIPHGDTGAASKGSASTVVTCARRGLMLPRDRIQTIDPKGGHSVPGRRGSKTRPPAPGRCPPAIIVPHPWGARASGGNGATAGTHMLFLFSDLLLRAALLEPSPKAKRCGQHPRRTPAAARMGPARTRTHALPLWPA